MSEQPDAPDRRRFLCMTLYSAVGAYAGALVVFGRDEEAPPPRDLDDLERFEWGFIVDTTRCIGCGACVRACRIENDVPDRCFRTWVERYEIEDDGTAHVDSPNGALESFKSDRLEPGHAAKAFFVPKLCNHCRASACTQVCPVGATFESPDGVVLIDQERCIGCGYCVQACPYACRYIDHDRGVADKCTLCYHRLHRGLEPACVGACPCEARISGNLRDPNSRIRRVLRERRYNLLKPELSTDPKCYYLGLEVEVK